MKRRYAFHHEVRSRSAVRFFYGHIFLQGVTSESCQKQKGNLIESCVALTPQITGIGVDADQRLKKTKSTEL
jgi:hypothetical protein